MSKVEPDHRSPLRGHATLPQMKSTVVPDDPSARMNLDTSSPSELAEYAFEDAKTLYECLLRGCRVSENGEFLGYRTTATSPYTWIRYRTAVERAHRLGCGLVTQGAKPHKSVVGVFSQNRPEYLLVEYGCYAFGMVLSPLYDTLGLEAVQHIVTQTEMEIVVVDTEQKILTLLQTKAVKQLKLIVYMNDVSEETLRRLDAENVQSQSLADLELLGKDNDLELQPAAPDDLAVICYTSGTTGVPKGVMSTHRNYVSSSGSIVLQTQSQLELTNDDSHISYLPLAHSYERLAITTLVMCGGRVGFFFGDITKLTDDIKELKPTIFSTVPRLLNRLYDRVTGTVQEGGCLKRLLFNKAMSSKQKQLEQGTIKGGTFWDKLVFKKVQQGLGGRLRFLATGSAPLSQAVMDFTRCVAGAPVVEGYGQTENAGAASCTLLGENNSGVVGVPLRCCMLKLVDIPDMNYYAAQNQGEVCIKGHNVFRGYFKDPAKTAETLDAQGWLHTGDVGEWTQDGCLKIIDRKKNIFKLAQGEYVAPEKIENIYIRSSALAQMFVFGNSLKSTLVGIGFIDPEKFESWIVEKTGNYGDIKQMCEDPQVVQRVLDDITEIGKKAGLKSFEQVKKLRLESELMTVENGLLTPTLKAKRAEIATVFKQQLDALYEGLQ